MSASPEHPNPYAPPVSAELQAAPDPATLWTVEGGHLMVRDGARLPPVPLEGDLSEELTPCAQAFRASGASVLRILVMLVMWFVVTFVLVGSRTLSMPKVFIALIVVLILRLILRRGAAGKGAIARIQGFAGVTTLKARARRAVWRGRLVLASLPFLFLQIFRVPFPGAEQSWSSREVTEPLLGQAWMLIFIFLYLGAIAWALVDRRISAVRRRDGWFYMNGVSAAALHKLSELRQSPPPPLRLRKLHDFHQCRLSLGNLLAGRRNPWAVLVISLMKLFRARSLTRRAFAREEARVLPAAPPSMAEWWQEESADNELSTWQLERATALDSPVGDSLVLAARFLSPDRRHLCTLVLARLATGRAFAELRNIEFFSWVQGGRGLVTSSLAPMGPAAENLDYQVRRLDAEGLWRLHAQRSASVGLEVVDSAEDLAARVTRAQDELAARLHAAGIYGPEIEVELPAPLPVP